MGTGKMKRQILISSLILLFAAAFAIADDLPYKPGELLVRFADPHVDTQTKNSILNSIFGCSCSPVVKEYSIVPGLTLIELPAGMTVEQARVSLSQSSDILYTGPNYKVSSAIIPNDTRFSELWGMRNTGQSGGTIDADIDAPEAWDMHTGSRNVVVAVTDTGVDYTHSDLAANRWVNTGEIPGNGLDDDGNGYVDDTYGYDFFNIDGNPMDDNGHGTHVSGTIGAVGNNNIGVAGVCWTVKIMALKFLNASGGGTIGDAVDAIEYATAMGAHIINASWGGYFYQQDSQGLYDAIAAARDAGILFVAAAGNDNLNNDTTLPPYNPASYNLGNIIAVMATTDTDGQAYYSNYGLVSVDLGAPGGAQQYENDPRGILSTLPGNQYGFSQGTSMASPHVAGACALMWATYPSLTYSQIKEILLDMVDPTLPGLCVSGGRLNLFNALSYDIVPPSPDPAKWEIEPQATGLHTIAMEAKIATDNSGVEYFFECVTDSSFNSGWQSGTLYERGDFDANTTYTFRVKYRDKSENQNETGWSIEKSATTASGSDTLPPFPNPSRWAIEPHILTGTVVGMEAKTSSDESGVEYYFEETTDPNLFRDWDDSPEWVIMSGLSLGYTYTFRCQARDKSAAQNTTGWSVPVSVTMGPPPRVLEVPFTYPTIQSAIDAANNGDIIVIHPGIYVGTGFEVHKNITIKSINHYDPGVVAATVIDYEGGWWPAFELYGSDGGTCALKGITIINSTFWGTRPGPPGTQPGDNGGNGSSLYGSGIKIAGNHIVENCVIRDCGAFGQPGGDGADGGGDFYSEPPSYAPRGGNGGGGGTAAGGGIYISRGNPTITGCTINRCTVTAGDGGFGGNGVDGTDDPNMPGGGGGNGGNAGSARGGGIYIDYDCNVTLIDCTIMNCMAFGGAAGDGGNGGDPCIPNGGSGDGGDGGNPSPVLGAGVYCEGNTIFINCTFSNNQAYGGYAGDGGDAGFVLPRYGEETGGKGGLWLGQDLTAKGGGVYVEDHATVTFTGCKFKDNVTRGSISGLGGLDSRAARRQQPLHNTRIQSFGAGLCSVDDSNVIFTDCKVQANYTTDEPDQYVHPHLNPPDNLDLYPFGPHPHTEFNLAVGHHYTGVGGGMCFEDSNYVELGRCNITENYAPIGGGLFGTGLTNSFRVYNSSFVDNEAEVGGAALWSFSAADINNCKVTGNVTAGDAYCSGAGFYINNSSSIIKNSVFSGNSADGAGGALFFFGPYLTGGTQEITNCLITDNTAFLDGGGISCYTYAELWITNCTLVGNEVLDYAYGHGGGVSCYDATVWLESSILWDNDAAYGPQISVGDPLELNNPETDVMVTHCDVEGGQDDVFEGTGQAKLWWLSGNINEDPLFATTKVYEQTYFLSQGPAGQDVNSPCVDAGSGTASALAAAVGFTPTTRTDLVADVCTVDMGYHYEAGLEVPIYWLDIEVIDKGYGTFGTVLPPWEPNTYYVNQGRVIELHAKPDDGWEVYEWTGVDYVNPVDPNYSKVTMNSNKTVTVEFGPRSAYMLVTHVIGNGTIEPAGLTFWPPGTVVPLTATPDNPSEVIMWTGTDDDFSSSSYNTVTMDAHKEVTVEFYAPQTLYVPGEYSSLQPAIDAASDGDIIILAAAGSDQPYISSWGYVVIDKAITIASPNPDDPCCVANTVIEKQVGPGGSGQSGFYFENVGRNTILNGITLRQWSGVALNGRDADDFEDPNIWDGEPGNRAYGGAIYLEQASPTIKNCIITDCSIIGGDGGTGRNGDDDHPNGGNGGWPGAAYGGAIACLYGSSPAIINCTFRNNAVTGGTGGNGGNGNDAPNWGRGGRGGGYYYWYTVPSPWQWLGGDDDYTDPSKYSGRGGAVYVGPGSAPTFTDCTFINNQSIGGFNGICGINGEPAPLIDEPSISWKIDNLGGAVFCDDFSTVEFVGCTFSGNVADTTTDPNNDDPYASYGGAVAFTDNANVSFENCTFNENEACVGGGMYWKWAELQIDDCNFVGNSAYHGGGMLFVGGAVNITRGKFSENEATGAVGQGGAICCLGANAQITDCSISGNDASGSGGGIYISNKDIYGEDISGESAVLVKNCLITGNSASRDGGGISANWHSEPNIVNCTIADNTVTGTGFEVGYGGGLYCSYSSYVNIINSIIWGNLGNIGAKGSQLAIATGFKYNPMPSTVNVTYSDVQDATDPNAFGARIEALDLVFLIDTTGSMFDDIDAVKDAAYEITGAIVTKIPDSRIAVVEYKDFNQPDYGGETDYPYRTVLGFTIDTGEVVDAIASLTASGGADWPESVYTALMHCIDHNSLAETLDGELYGADPESIGPGVWRSGDVLRVIILMGDAPPHDPEPFTDYTLEDITAAAAAAGIKPIRVVPLLVGEDVETANYFGSLASETGGTVLQAAGAGEVVEALMDAIELISRIPDPIFVDANCILNWDANSYTWHPNSHNIDEDPYFVDGYYLSQIASGQLVTSSCVDAGSDTAENLGLDEYTTSTDGMFDVDIVDMGYHYLFASWLESCKLCELFYDGIINFKDFAVLALNWLSEDCSWDNDWCQHVDVTFDSYVNFKDVSLFAECWLVEDTEPPFPNPSEWAIKPYSNSPTSITMTARTAVDRWGGPVEYYFKCVSSGCDDSGWQSDPNYTDLDLVFGVEYGYKVRTRDASMQFPDDGTGERGNKTGWSIVQYATAGEEPPPPPDHNAPIPNPMTWATVPYATSTTSIAMVATTAVDDTAGVEYYFEDFYNPAVNSGWQSSPAWEDTTCEPGTTYTYRVRARDTSPWHNQTGWSTLADATTFEEDLTPPTPDPMTWATAPYATSPTSVRMVASIATDPSGVEYYFECTSHSIYSSGWQDSRIYAVTVAEGALYTFVVRARDKSPNQNTTADSPEIAVDPDPPTPNPMTWETEPYRASATSISMVASIATDASGVEYYFQCTSNALYNSGWRTGRTYTVSGLPSGLYAFVVRARDRSPNRNTTANSNQVVVDLNPPTPLAWEVPPYETGSGLNAFANMTAAIATDPEGNNPVQYYFECTEIPSINSGWTLDPEWNNVPIGRENQFLYFHFRIRDSLGNTSAWSTSLPCY